MGEDGQRAGRIEQRNLAQLEADFSNLREELITLIELLGDTLIEHSAALDRVDNTMTEAHKRGANVPLSPFHGLRKEDFSQHIKQFELICDANNYAAEKRAQILGSYLRDKAFFIYDSLPDATKSNYAALKCALCEKFQTTDYRRYAHQKFQERKQQPTETVPDYACDLHRMGLAALSEVNADQRDALIREKFIAGLLPYLRELIVYCNPESFHEAMTLAERLEGVQANKTDSSARKVLLLENISDRLANLEIQNQRTQEASHYPDVTYVMEARNRNIPNDFSIQRKFNLGNYRQGFRPSGMVCYRCNRTGHMARNCGRTRDMNTVICRLCNHMGHFARDCQRRGNNFSRHSTSATNREQINVRENRPLRTSERQNRTMAVTAMTAEPGISNSKEPPGFSRWKPLTAAMWIVDKNRKHGKEAVEVLTIKPMEESKRKVATNTASSNREKRASAEELTSQPNATKQSINTASAGNTETYFQTVAHQFTSLKCSETLWLFCCLFVAMTTGVIATANDDNYKHSDPMLCQASGGKALWKLPTTFNCPKGKHTADRNVSPMRFRLYKRNFVQYRSDAWKCVRITEEVQTFSYFFGDENLKRETKYDEAVSAEDCVMMKHYKTCKNQALIYQGGIYQTANTLKWQYPGGGINCCHWKSFKVSNCFLYQTLVYKRHGAQEMESTSDDVSNCNYASGQCVLSDGAFLLWDVRNASFCKLLPWKTLNGQMFGTSWLSGDSNLALTFTKGQRAIDCEGRPLLLSDQGIPVLPLTESANIRHKRESNLTELPPHETLAGEGVIVSVSSAQLAASLQALEVRWEQNMQFAFSHALNNVCNFMRSVLELLKTQVLANPTMAIRPLTNRTDIYAKSGGNVIEVFPCTQIDHHHYSFKTMNGTCTLQIPIRFKINNETNGGYLDPITNIVHRFAVPVDCNLVKQVPLQLRDKTYIYHASNGELTSAHDIPEIKILQWNMEPVINMKSTISHEIVIYNWEDLQTHISLNDILGGLDRQRTILRHIGITDQNVDPKGAAENAVTSIMNKGYFGFLRGLATNLFQVWTFLVCLYVSIGVLVMHCVPMRVMPAALNLGNAANRLRNLWHCWRQRPRPSLIDPPDFTPDIGNTNALNDAALSKFTTALLHRMNRRIPNAILPPPDNELPPPTAPLIETGQQVPLTANVHSTSTKLTAAVQPFRINVIYLVSETTITVTSKD